MTPLILALWYTSIAVSLLCLAMLVYRRLALRYPGLSALLVTSLAGSGYLLAVWLSGQGNGAYCRAWSRAQPFAVAANAIVALDAFWAMAKFRKTGSFGVALVTVFAGLSALAVWSTVNLVVPGFNPAMVTARYYGAICFGFLLLSVLFWRSSPMRMNARWYVRGLLVSSAGGTLTYNLLFVWNTPALRAASMLPAIICYALWAIKMVPAGEAFIPVMTAEECELLLAEAERKAGIIREVRKHARKGGYASVFKG